MFKPHKTTDEGLRKATKTLLYAPHGYGKTTTCRYYRENFGKGFILSGEAGLLSLSTDDIDYLPFSSWDGPHDPSRDTYSFRGLCNLVNSKEFNEQGYAWIAVDSLTEASDLLMKELEVKYKDVKNTYAMWGEFARSIISSLKWLRDRPMHVLVTALAKDEEDEEGRPTYWPYIHGRAAAKVVPAIFDNVLAGVRETTTDKDSNVRVHRYLVADQVHGYHGKIRDPRRRIPPIIHTSNVAEVVLAATQYDDKQFELWLSSLPTGANT